MLSEIISANFAGTHSRVDVGYDAEVADVFHKSHKNVCKYTKYFGFTEGSIEFGYSISHGFP